MSRIPLWARAAIAIAVLWVASSALFPLLALLGTYDGHVGPALVGSGIPAEAWRLPAPWPLVVGSASTVTIAALVGFGVGRVSPVQPHSRRQLFFTVWFIVIAAAAVTGAVQRLGLVIDGPITPAYVAVILPGAVASAMYVGLIFGWIPAWLVIARPTVAPSSPTGRRIPVVVGIATIVAVTLLIASISAGLSFHQTAMESSREEEPVPTPVPVPTDPPPLVAPNAPTADQIDPTWCIGPFDYLDGGGDAALGSRKGSIVIYNKSESMCVLQGYPDLAFADDDGNAVYADVTPGTVMETDDVTPQRLELQPDEVAIAFAGWRATDGRTVLRSVLVAPYAGANRTQVYLDHGWDLTDASQVTVSPWQRPRTADPFSDSGN